MTIKLIVWDMDGTLFPSNADYTESAHKAAALAAIELGAELSYQQAYDMGMACAKRTGVWYPDFCERFGFTKTEFHDTHMAKVDIETVKPCKFLCAEIKNMTSVEHAILTHANHSLASAIMQEKLNIHDVFGDNIFGLDFMDFNKKSDSAEGHSKLLQKLGVTPAEAIMVDDSPINLKYPKEIGMNTVFITNGKDVKCDHADVVYENTYEFIRDFNAGNVFSDK